MPLPRTLVSRDIGATADPDYHCGKNGIDPEFELMEDCLLRIGFTAPKYFGELMRAHQTIVNSWSSKNNGTYGPQKDAILKSTTFTNKMVLNCFDAPSIVGTSASLLRARRFTSDSSLSTLSNSIADKKGLCLLGLGMDRYVDMASALCTVMSLCLENGDSRVRAMVASIAFSATTFRDLIAPFGTTTMGTS
jgi:hypothetical protein